MEFQAANSPATPENENDSNVSTEESDPETGETATGDELRTYIIIVNDDGSLTLDTNGQLTEDADPQTVIPVHLPVNKMKSQDCPLPGATPIPGSSRTRKSKPQAVLYGGDGDGVFHQNVPGSGNRVNFIIPTSGNLEYNNDTATLAQRQLVNGTGILQQQLAPESTVASTTVTTTGVGPNPPIDIGELGPQDMAYLENVLLQSEMRGNVATDMSELLENFSFPTDEAPTISASVPSLGVTNHLWDHSYSMVHPDVQSATQQPSTVQSSVGIENQHEQIKKPSTVSAPVPVQPAKSIISRVTFSHSTENQPQPLPPRTPLSTSPNISSITSSASSSTSSTTMSASNTPTSRRISEGDSNAASIRRSQRQQDRIERQEAERIMAENQEILRREKEQLMMESSGIIPGVSPNVIPNTPTIIKQVDPTISQLPSAHSSKSGSSSSPVTVHDDSSTEATSLSRSLQLISPTTVKVSSEESPRSDSRRPTRHRKLPAHLADPNIIHLDQEESKILIQETVMSKDEDAEEKVEPEPPSEEDEEDSEDGDDGEEEDDPNKLWCICRQPHNGRFMICCDKCDDWFHGKCVGITKTQAAQMESRSILWHCPKCKKTMKQTPPAPKAKVGRPSGRRGSEAKSETSMTSSLPVIKDKKQQQHQQQQQGRRKSTSISETPKGRDSIPKATGRKSESIHKQPHETAGIEDDGTDCIVCGKKARPDSVYCSNECVVQHSKQTKPQQQETSSTLIAPNNNAAAGPQQKLKRMNSLKTEQEKAKNTEPFLTFHVIQSGSAKSTEVVPPRQKEPNHGKVPSLNTSTSPLALSKSNQSPTKGGSTPTTPSPIHTPIQLNHQNQPHSGSGTSASSSKMGSESSKHGVVRDRHVSSSSKDHKSEKDTAKGTKSAHGGRSSSTSEKTTPKEKATTPKEKITPKEKKVKATKESLRELEKEKDAKYGRDAETLMKENIRKTIRETLKTRLNNVTEEDKAAFPSTNTPEFLAERIEEELTILYGGANNAKCKSKYRSIYFNLRDVKNFLFREILQGNIKPRDLVKMEPTEMASAELSEWRNRENQKNLEMIKKAELDKLAEAKKQELLDKGAEVEAVEKVEQEARKLDISDVIGTKESKGSSDSEKREEDGSEKSSSKSHSSHRRKDKKRDKDKHHRDSKDHHSSSRDKERERKDSSSSSSTRDKDKKLERRRSRDELDGSKSKSKDSEKDKSSSKDKAKSSSSSTSKDREHKKDRDSKRESDKHGSASRDKDVKNTLTHQDSSEKLGVKSENISPEDSQSLEGTPVYSSSESSLNQSDSLISKLEHGVRHSTDSEQEMPSSTIKTPDFTDEKKEKPIFRTKLVMHELGSFGAGVYHVSHNSLEGTIFPESPVPIVGRISPDTVWDYIDKMKKTKEVIILRLAPDTPADSEGYMTFFTYLSSRGRLGVMGGLIPPLKDVYLIPLDKHGPVNRALLPFRGPGLPKDRNHCLLAVVTRHVMESSIPPMIQAKRKASLAGTSPSTPPKKKKVSPVDNGDKLSPGSSRHASSRTNRSSITGSKTSPFAAPVPLGKASVESTKIQQGGEADKEKPVEVDPVDLKDDDDEPYTPWEDEDDKEVSMELGTPNSSQAVDKEAEKQKASELLEQLNAQIQREKEEIAAMTRKETIIPGLDGDFPKESSSPILEPPVPFFLRDQKQNQELSPSLLSPQKPSTLTATNLPSGTGSNILEEKSQLEDEAYSPSAIDFSDEEEKDENKGDLSTNIQKIEEPTSKVVVNIEEEDDDDNEPLPPGVEEEEKGPSDVRSTKTIIPPEVIDLDDDEDGKKGTADNDVKELEPPPPPPQVLDIDREFKTLPKPLLSSTDSVFSFTPLNVSSPKNIKKIQINLAPKTSLGSSSVLSAIKNNETLTASTVPTPTTSTTTKSLSEAIVVPTSSCEPNDSSNSSANASNIATSVPPPSSSVSNLPFGVQTNVPPPLPSVSIPNINIPPPTLMTSLPSSLQSNLSSVNTVNIPPPSVLGKPFLPPPPNFMIPPSSSTVSAVSTTNHRNQAPNLIPAPTIGGLNINVNVPPPITGMVPVSAIPPPPSLRGMPNINPGIRFPPQSSFPPQQQQQLGRFGPQQSLLSSSSLSSATTSFQSSSSSSAGTMLLSSNSSVLLRPTSSSSLPPVNNKNFSDNNSVDGLDTNSRSSNSGSFQSGMNKRPFGDGGRKRSRSKSNDRNDRNFRSRSRSRDRRRRRYSRSRSPKSRRYGGGSRSRSPHRSRDRSKSPSSSRRHHSGRTSPSRKSSSSSSSSRNRDRGGGRSKKSRSRSRSGSPINVSTPVVKK